jgi:glycine/D-amino acid oxidase-like deaminating enzyme
MPMVAQSPAMSRSPDVAVIGGGIIGCSASALLAERGATVTLFEATAIGAGASGRPFIGPVAGVAGLFVCAGHGPWGISTGPGSAELAVNALLDGAPVPAELAADRPI